MIATGGPVILNIIKVGDIFLVFIVSDDDLLKKLDKYNVMFTVSFSKSVDHLHGASILSAS